MVDRLDERIRHICPVYDRQESERLEYRVQDTPELEEGGRGWPGRAAKVVIR